MPNEPGIPITKPVSVWNKPINADFKELFKTLGKGAIKLAAGQMDGLAEASVETVAALGLVTQPGEVAWLLIYRSLTQAMFSLVEGNKELLVYQANKPNLGELCNRLDLSLESMNLRIDEDFFRRPKDLPIVEKIKTPFKQWLEGFGVTEAQAETISNRLPTYFVYALNQEWANHPDKYICLKENLATPFTQASEREQGWLHYLAWLQKQVEEPMFLEAFGLKQVYVPLRAYYKRKVDSLEDEEFERRVTEDKKYQRVVINLESELQTWLNNADRNDAIRVINGGPGCGKSSFAKMFAAKQAEKEIPVLFIPLHHFDPSDDLVDAVGKFVRDDSFLRHNPLDRDNGESRLLIIFDGLDELAMQGKVAAEIAQQFVREVQRKVERFNFRETRLQVLISGREFVVQANSSDFRQPQQILSVLPYFVSEDEKKRENYIDEQDLLKQDQRQLWWESYGRVTGRWYAGLPIELDQDNLIEITSQPLLNYLVALSFVRGELKFSENSNLNALYEDLLKAVHKRVWEDYPHPTLRGIEYKDFVRILEEIALASWHGDGRTTTVKEIESHCENSGFLKRLLDIVQEGAKVGVTRLLTAFYFRQSGANQHGEKTFEFTHKSFGEYLTAKRIVREVRCIHEMLKRRQYDPDEGWDETDALQRWATLCGASAMDIYLFNFVVDEIGLHNESDVGNWQQTLCHLIAFMLRHGMPMERLNPRPDFQEENRQARNAEEALLAVLNACARLTKKISKIEWHSPEAFGTWISRLQGQRIQFENIFALNCLSFLDLQECILTIKDFYEANFEGTNLKGANLAEANLAEAILAGADLTWANLKGAILGWANLKGAILYKANLEGAILEGALLKGALLAGANFAGADLTWANFAEANLKWANLRGTILEGKDLTQLNEDSGLHWGE